MLKYVQRSGYLYDALGRIIGIGYAGRGVGKNNPLMQDVKGIGPLPCGRYTIQAPHDHAVVGKYAMALIPDPTNDMYQRNSFYLHGDDVENPGSASHGCIVMSRAVREKVWTGVDHTLEVISGL